MDHIAYRRLFKNHGTSIGYWEGWVEPYPEGAKVILQYARTLDGKVTRREFTAEPKNIGRSNETTSLMQAQLELDSRNSKQLDKGYVTALDQASEPVTNTLGREKPMLAQPLEKVKPEDIDWGSTYAQPKLDGHRAMWKDGVLYSRQGKPLNIPHVVEAIKANGLEHLHLDGELYIHGKTLQEISSLIKRNQEGSEALVYCLYDTVDSRPWIDRINQINVVLRGRYLPALRVLKAIPVSSFEYLHACHDHNLNDGFEGTMLRWGHRGYEDGKRSKHLLKMKNFQDAEFEIIGFNEGKPYVTPEATYRVPVWVCQTVHGKVFTVTAQGDRHEKHALWESRHDHMGKPLTVKYHYESKLGIPQLPVALRFQETV